MVSGRNVREVFLNNDFNFEAALGKVAIKMGDASHEQDTVTYHNECHIDL